MPTCDPAACANNLLQLLCKAAKEDRAQLKRLEAESARLVKRAERGEADKQLLQAQLKELQVRGVLDGECDSTVVTV
jgi:hypothetical protein